MVSLEPSWDAANEAQQLVDITLPRRDKANSGGGGGGGGGVDTGGPLTSPQGGGFFTPLSTRSKNNKFSPSQHDDDAHFTYPRPPLSPASSVGSLGSSSSSTTTRRKGKKTTFDALMDTEAHGIGSNSSVASAASSSSSSFQTTNGSKVSTNKKDPKLLAKSLRRKRTHLEVRETDFVRAGHDWEVHYDGTHVFIHT
jgi:hypothetical protein